MSEHDIKELLAKQIHKHAKESEERRRSLQDYEDNFIHPLNREIANLRAEIDRLRRVNSVCSRLLKRTDAELNVAFEVFDWGAEDTIMIQGILTDNAEYYKEEAERFKVNTNENQRT